MVSPLCISLDLKTEKENLVSLPWGLAAGFVPSLRWGRKRALLYLQEQSLLLCLPMGEQIPCLRLQALAVALQRLRAAADGAYLEKGKGVNPETTPDFAAVRSGTPAELQGQKKVRAAWR